jgi:3-hydroxyanthranilate 3,4-dioxygenase
MPDDDNQPDLTVTPTNLLDWISRHPDAFRPPVANRVLFEDDSFIVMLVRGPNQRNDFHIDPNPEVFFQLRGTIRVDTRTDEGATVHHLVGEGEMFVVPGDVPHAPLRPADTWGLVIERPRTAAELDVITWFCRACGNEVNRSPLQVTEIDVQLHPILEAFAQDEQLRTCDRCGTVHPVATEFVLPDGTEPAAHGGP